MSRDRKPEPIEKLPDWCMVDSLSDGSIRVAPRGPGVWWSNSSQEEWQIGPDSLEVRRPLFGTRRVRRYTGASLTIHDPPGSPLFHRSLVVGVRGKSHVLAVGASTDIRALGAFLSKHTGWSMQISRAEPGKGGRSTFLPLAGLFILGGLVVAGDGCRQYREGWALQQRPGAVRVSDVRTAKPGAPVVVTGRVKGAASDDHDPVMYDEYVYRIRPKEGEYWELTPSSRPDFTLLQDYDSTIVLSGQYPLIRPPHRWTDSNRRFEGFWSGDLVTVLGTMTSDRDRRGLRARMVFGGTEYQLSQSIQREGMLGMAAGAGSILVGVALLRGLSRPRRHRRGG